MTATIEWIPVAQELPDDETEVLAWTGNQFFLASREAGTWRNEEQMPIRVTHWAHLPDVPQ